MHREIQIKQFPIVTTHWWPKTRNERFVWENEQYLYRFLPLVHNHVQVIWVPWTGLGICMRRSDWLTPPLALEKLRQHHASDTPSIKRWRRRPVWMQPKPERAHTHTSQITWTWLCTRGKKRYKYCSFSHTNRSFRVLGHQCVVTMGNCLISLCMFFFPLIETVTYTCHYMTDRLERFDLKTSKLDLLKKKDNYILDALGVSW